MNAFREKFGLKASLWVCREWVMPAMSQVSTQGRTLQAETFPGGPSNLWGANIEGLAALHWEEREIESNGFKGWKLQKGKASVKMSFTILIRKHGVINVQTDIWWIYKRSFGTNTWKYLIRTVIFLLVLISLESSLSFPLPNHTHAKIGPQTRTYLMPLLQPQLPWSPRHRLRGFFFFFVFISRKLVMLEHNGISVKGENCQSL